MSEYLFSSVISQERDRIPRLPIDLWVKQLNNKFLDQVKYCKNTERFAILELIINQLSLILFYINEVSLARCLCIKAQSFFFAVYVERPVFSCPNKFGVVQPWINLIRIERFLKNFVLVTKMVESLKSDNARYKLGNYIIHKNKLSTNTQQLLSGCYIDEKLKLLVANQKYIALLNFIEESAQNSLVYTSQILLFLEARAIALFHQGKANLIPDFITNIIKEAPENERNIFRLKLVHYYIDTNNKSSALGNLNELLSNFSVDSSTPLYILRFWLNVGKTFHKLSAFKKMNKIFSKLYDLFYQKTDELSLWEMSCLMKDTSYSNAEWEHIATESSYFITNQKLSKSFFWHQDCIEFNTQINEYIFSCLNYKK